MVCLELRRDSRVTTGNSGFLLCWPRKSNLPFELPGRAGDWAPFTEGQTRPHLGLYPGLNVPLHRRQGFGVAFHTLPGNSNGRLDFLGQHKRKPEFPVVTRESDRNSRKTTCFPRHRKMRPFVRYSISREVPRSILKCETVLGTLDATPKVPRHTRLTQGEHRGSRHHFI